MKAAAMKAMKVVNTEAKGTFAKKAMKAAAMKAMKVVNAEAKGFAKKAMKAAAMKAMKVMNTEAKGTFAKKAMKAAAMKAMKCGARDSRWSAPALRCAGRLRCVDVATLVERRPVGGAPRGAGARTLVRWLSVCLCIRVQKKWRCQDCIYGLCS